MSTPTLKVTPGGTLVVQSLGNVFDEDVQIFNKLLSVTLPLSGTASAINANFSGKKRVLTITGAHSGQGYDTGTTEGNINAFITDMETWVNAGKQSSRYYTDSLGNEYEVISLEFVRTRQIDALGRILYSLTMVEGNVF